MSTAVITGSARGIGFGMAGSFLEAGWNVVINGRTAATVAQAVEALSESGSRDRIAASPGDIRSTEQMELLYQTAVDRFGSVDIWVNNAGIGHPYHPVWELKPELIREIYDVNLYGATIAASVAIRNMKKQGFGHVYHMEGFGSNGRLMANLSVYGASKRGLRYLARALARETRGTGVKVSRISPGMVATDFISGQYAGDPEGFEAAKKVFNILADRVETVAPWLVKKMIGNTRNDALFQWLTTPKILWRFMSSSFIKRDVFDT